MRNQGVNLKRIEGVNMCVFSTLICGVLLFFTINDEQHFDKNKCERIALKEISDSKCDVVRLHNDCTVLSWKKTVKPEDSQLNAQLLTLWKVTKYNKLYYNE